MSIAPIALSSAVMIAGWGQIYLTLRRLVNDGHLRGAPIVRHVPIEAFTHILAGTLFSSIELLSTRTGRIFCTSAIAGLGIYYTYKGIKNYNWQERPYSRANISVIFSAIIMTGGLAALYLNGFDNIWALDSRAELAVEGAVKSFSNGFDGISPSAIRKHIAGANCKSDLSFCILKFTPESEAFFAQSRINFKHFFRTKDSVQILLENDHNTIEWCSKATPLKSIAEACEQVFKAGFGLLPPLGGNLVENVDVYLSDDHIPKGHVILNKAGEYLFFNNFGERATHIAEPILNHCKIKCFFVS